MSSGSTFHCLRCWPIPQVRGVDHAPINFFLLAQAIGSQALTNEGSLWIGLAWLAMTLHQIETETLRVIICRPGFCRRSATFTQKNSPSNLH